jgi:hypothetical protein
MRAAAVFWLLIGATATAAAQGSGTEAAQALLRSVIDHREAMRPLEGRLTFRQLITTEALDEEREVVATATALYEYEPVFGRHLWKLLELDGEPIQGRRFRREERRYRRAIEAAEEEAEEDRRALERQDPDYEVLPKNGMDLFYKIVKDAIELGMFEGELLRTDTWRGRPVQVIRFWPRAGFGDAPNRMMSVVSKCEGELWVDVENRQIARVRTVLTEEENFIAGLFGRLHRGTSADVESEFDGRLWLPKRVTMTVDARMYFIRRIRRRVHYDFLNFRSLSAAPDR